MEALGIKFAPLNVPLSRRLQTLSAFFWIFSLIFGNFVCLWLVAYCIFFTRLYPLALLYLFWAYHDRRTPYIGGRRLSIVRKFQFWKHFRDYFPIKLAKTAELPPDRNYLLCVYPHGLLSAGVFGNFANDYSEFPQLFPGLDETCTTIDVHFRVPLFRDYIMGFGAVSSSKESIEYLLNREQKGQAVVLIVGGAAESFYAKPGHTHRIILKKRKGFVKVALRSGASLVPVFSFGEIHIYDQVSNPPGSLLYRVQSWLRHFTGIVPCIPIGRGFWQYSFGLIPRRHPVTTVVGEPIDLPKISHPSEEDIDKYHSLFTEKLHELFNGEKQKYLKDWEMAELVIE